MPFSPSTSRRGFQPTHAIHLKAYVRDEGLWKFDARVTDIKTYDITLASAIQHVGKPMRRLSPSIIADAKFNVAVEVASMFYPRWAVKLLAQSESS